MERYFSSGDFCDGQAFLERADSELKRCRRYHFFVSLLLLDWRVLGFHIAGESKAEWVEQLVALLKERLRDADSITGFQSGILGVLLPHTNREDAFKVGHRLSNWAMEHLASEGAPDLATVRMGIAVHPSRAVTVKELFAEASRSFGSPIYLTTPRAPD